MQYLDITDNYKKEKEYIVKKEKRYIDTNGNMYKVDRKHVISKPTMREKEVARLMGQTFGGKISIIPRVNYPLNIKTPDYLINGQRYDLKNITGIGKYVIEGNLKGKKQQANNFIIDITNTTLDINEIERQVESIYKSKRYNWVEKIIIIKENCVEKIYERK